MKISGLFGLMTGITVKFGSKTSSMKSENERIRITDAEMFVEVNGGVSRIATRPYNPYYYYIASEMRKAPQAQCYYPVVLPNYEEVVRDTEGRQFQFVPCKRDNMDYNNTSRIESTISWNNQQQKSVARQPVARQSVAVPINEPPPSYYA